MHSKQNHFAKILVLSLGIITSAVIAETVYSPLSPVDYSLTANQVAIMTYKDSVAKMDLVNLESKQVTRLNPANSTYAYFFEYVINPSTNQLLLISHNRTTQYPIQQMDLSSKQWGVFESETSFKQSLTASGATTAWIAYGTAPAINPASPNRGDGNGSTPTPATTTEVFLKTGSSSPTQITRDNLLKEQVTTNGPYLAWVEYSKTGIGNIILYTISNQTQKTVSPGNFHQQSPQLCKDWLVWEDYRSNPKAANVYAYSLKQNLTLQISSQNNHQGKPSCNDSVVVWEDYRETSGLGSIYGRVLKEASLEFSIAKSVNHLSTPKISDSYLTWYEMTSTQITLVAKPRDSEGPINRIQVMKNKANLNRSKMKFTLLGQRLQ